MNKGQAFIFSISLISLVCYPLPVQPTALSDQVYWFHGFALSFIFYQACIIARNGPEHPQIVAFYFASCCTALGLYLRALRHSNYESADALLASLAQWKPPIVPLLVAIVGSAIVWRSWQQE